MILTPILLTRSVHIRRIFIIDEDVTEAILLSFLFTLSLLMSKLYKNEASKQIELINNIKKDKEKADEKLFDSLDYIGKVNVQIEEIKSIFDTSNAYPETRNDFKRTVRSLAEHVLGIVNTNWVLLRIIGNGTQRTIYECFATREGYSCCYPHVSNKMTVEQQSTSDYTTVISRSRNLNFLVFCAMPVDTINNDQRVFIQAIMNEITMLFIILNSSNDKIANRVFVESRSKKKAETIRPSLPA